MKKHLFSSTHFIHRIASLLLLLTFSVSIIEAAPQIAPRDSLFQLLSSETSKVQQVELELELMRSMGSINLDSSLRVCSKIISLENSKHNETAIWIGEAFYFIKSSKIDSAKFYYIKALSDLDKPEQLGTRVRLQAVFIDNVSEFDNIWGYQLSFEAIKDAKKLKRYDLVSDLYMGQNLVYVTLNPNAALSYADSAIYYAYLSKDKRRISNRTGLKGQTFEKQFKHDSAIFYVQLAIDLIKEDTAFNYARATNYLLLLDCYAAKNDTANFLARVNQYCDYVENTPAFYWKLPAKTFRAKAHLYRGEMKEAIRYYREILSDSRFSTSLFKEDVYQLYYNLSTCYAALGDYKNSQIYLDTAHTLYKQINDFERSNTLRDLEALGVAEQQQADMQIKEGQLKSEQAETERKLQQRNYSLAGTGLLLLLTLALIFNYYRIRKLNVQLDIEKHRAEKSEKFKQQFLANMSHEIRSPMNAALGAVNLASMQNNSTKTNEYLQTANRSTKNLLRIIDDILDLSKIEAGKLFLEHEVFSVEEVATNVISANQIMAGQKKLALKLAVNDAAKVFVKGDSLRLSQVLNNLISNALKFTEKGEVALEISLEKQNSMNPPLSYIKFIVSDSGIGTGEQLKHLFQTYNQAEAGTSRKYGGTGLGLSITKQLLGLMNGKIEVESSAGVSTRFMVAIPFEVVSPEEVQLNLAKENLEINHTENKTCRIFIADDIEDNRTITRDLIQEMFPNAIIKTSSNGKELVEQLRQVGKLSQDCCVFLDLDMPVMNGFEAVKIIREELKLSIPVFALSASVFIATEQEYKNLGFEKLITKPVAPIILSRAIVDSLGRS